MDENGENKLLAMARHIAKMLGRKDTMANDICKFSPTLMRDFLARNCSRSIEGKKTIPELARHLNTPSSFSQLSYHPLSIKS